MYGIYLGVEKSKITEYIKIRQKNNMFKNMEIISFPKWINKKKF